MHYIACIVYIAQNRARLKKDGCEELANVICLYCVDSMHFSILDQLDGAGAYAVEEITGDMSLCDQIVQSSVLRC